MEELTEQQVLEHIRAGGVEFVTAQKALDSESCVDGREQGQVLGLPGGTLGEVIVAAVAMERRQGRIFTEHELNQLVTTWPNYFGPIYLHTDTHGLRNLHDAMSSTLPFDAKTVEAEIRQPTSPDTLLRLLVDPQNIGCGHIKNMINHASEYSARPELVTGILKEVYRISWDSAYSENVNFTVLDGDHQERGVLVVTAKDFDPRNLQDLLPMVRPNVNSQQFFVYQPQLAGVQRLQAAQRAHALTGIPELAAEPDRMLQAMHEIGELQLNQTLGRLAPGKPTIQVIFDARNRASEPVVVRKLIA